MRERAMRATARAVRASSAAFDAVRAPVTRAYEATMRENAEYVVRDPTRAKRLGREFVYTNLARVPGAMRAAAAEVEVVKELGMRARMGELDVATAATGAVFAAELYAWFAVGEIVGRGGKLTGY